MENPVSNLALLRTESLNWLAYLFHLLPLLGYQQAINTVVAIPANVIRCGATAGVGCDLYRVYTCYNLKVYAVIP